MDYNFLTPRHHSLFEAPSGRIIGSTSDRRGYPRTSYWNQPGVVDVEQGFCTSPPPELTRSIHISSLLGKKNFPLLSVPGGSVSMSMGMPIPGSANAIPKRSDENPANTPVLAEPTIGKLHRLSHNL